MQTKECLIQGYKVLGKYSNSKAIVINAEWIVEEGGEGWNKIQVPIVFLLYTLYIVCKYYFGYFVF